MTDFRFLRNGDIIILEKKIEKYLSYFKQELRQKYLVNLNDSSKTELIDSKVNLKAKMIYAIMKQIPDSCLNFKILTTKREILWSVSIHYEENIQQKPTLMIYSYIISHS